MSDPLREALRRLVDSAVLVPMAAEDDDDVAECWVVHPEPLEEARAALAAAPQPQPDAGSLRKAAQAVVDAASDDLNPDEMVSVDPAAIVALVAALTAAPRDTLDVERLAEALIQSGIYIDAEDPTVGLDAPKVYAAAILAALGEEKP